MMHQPGQTGILLVNLGTPDSTSTADVRSYLRQFLMDGRVIDISPVGRFFLVNGVIAPFRAPKSAEVYRKVWTEQGSPLKIYGIAVKRLLQEALGPNFVVELGMRYKNPSVEEALTALAKANVERILVVPLFPQYAGATTGSVHEEVMRLLSGWHNIPQVSFIDYFYNHPAFIDSFVQVAQPFMQRGGYEHYVFSYHGLPERQIAKQDDHNHCLRNGCCDAIGTKNRMCYRAQCFATTRLLAERLGIAPENYTVCFQSRLGKAIWIQPYTEDVIKELAAKGVKRVLAFSPAFVADCLETTVEVGEEYAHLYKELGGQQWDLVPSLNDSPRWIEALVQLVAENLPAKVSKELLPQYAG